MLYDLLMNFDIPIPLLLFLPAIVMLLIYSWKKPVFFLCAHIFSRAVLDGFSDVTYQEIAFGLSLMQLYSMIIIFVMIIYLIFKIKRRIFDLPALIPVSAIIFSYLLSGVVSNDWMPIIENIIKWIYMILLSGIVAYCFLIYKKGDIILAIWIGVLPAVVNQAYSIFSGDAGILASGHYFYAGGFYHRNMLGYYLLVFIATSLFLFINQKSNVIKCIFLSSLIYGHFALYLCGYRTTIIALIVCWVFTLMFLCKHFNFVQRSITIYLFIISAGLIFYYIGSDVGDRLKDLWIFLSNPFSYLDFSGNQNVELVLPLMSGRIYMINILMSAYLSGPLEVIIAGFGIDASMDIIGTYPHNEYLSALVEAGIIGILALIFFIVYYLRLIFLSLKFSDLQDHTLLGMGIGLLVMTLATMPFRDMRAMIVFGLTLGFVNYLVNLKGKQKY